MDTTRTTRAGAVSAEAQSTPAISVDPITVEVVRTRLDVIADEMEMTLLESSYSSIVKEALDASAAIFDRDARTLAQAASLPAQLGMLMSATRRIRQVFPDEEMREGDISIMNDPYHGGTHLPDIVVLMPVFFEGKLVALSGSLSHHQDVGGKAPGSTPPDAQEIFAEGLRIPPMKLYDRGRPNTTLFELIALNVRTPDLALGDLRAQIACANVGARRIRQLYLEYGYETVGACIEELMNYAERMTRARLAEMPDGVYTFHDYVDDAGALHDRPVKIQVTLTLKGSDLTVDFTGSDPAVPTAINSVPASTNAMIYYVLRAVTDPHLPNNEGCYRPLKIILPEGSVVNPLPPHAVSCRTITCKRIVDALLGAFAQIVPHKVHDRVYGHQETTCPVEFVTLRVVQAFQLPTIDLGSHGPAPAADPAAASKGARQAYFTPDEGYVSTPVYGRAGLGPGATLTGPAIIEQADTTTVVYPGHACRVDALGNLVIEIP